MLAMKLSTTLGHIDNIPNSINASLVKDFYEYLKEIGTSENYQNQNIKQLIGFAKSLGSERTFYDTQKMEFHLRHLFGAILRIKIRSL